MKRFAFILSLIVLGITSVYAQDKNALRLPNFFCDGMVLQRDANVPVWGYADKSQKEVAVVINGKVARGKINKADGSFRVLLPKMPAGGPYTMKVVSIDKSGKVSSNGDVKGTNVAVKTINNVLIGDVFICSGQSNMELPIRRCMDVVANEVKDYSNDNIRYIKFPHQFNYVKPNDNVNVIPWQNITPQNCAEVSGICYFMARELQEKYNVPIGIINSAVGGTQVQAWMPNETLATFDGYKEELAKQKYHQVNWVDSIRNLENKASLDWERKMTATDTIINMWKKADYSFDQWKTVDMFSNWSEGKNGSFWFETEINLPAELAGKKGILRFGAMKDADSIFVNGKFVGNTTYEYPPRIYTVPEGLLHEGKNEIVVHLMSQSGRANFTQGKLYQLEIGELTFPIAKEIKMAVGCTMPRKPASTYFVDTPTGLYNAMIAPLKDFPVKGMLWYQGESNMGSTATYSAMLEAMVSAWRKQWHNKMPVVVMQLPGYMSKHNNPVETGWTQIRHQQYLAAQNISGAGLAPTLDTGEFNDIHPQDKKTAGHRAALQMEKLAYAENIVSCGPMPTSAVIADGKAVITFSNETGKLTSKNTEGNTINDIAIKVDGKYQWAKATITDAHTLTVELPQGTTSTTIRYCWDDYPTPSLYNTDGIPAPQFEISTK